MTPARKKSIASGAELSACALYRYRLWRVWTPNVRRRCLFVMLNPSTADGTTDDATIRRCTGYAQDWQFDALDVANLFAWRSQNPKHLARVSDPVGPYNDEAIDALAEAAALVVCAWGTGGALHDRGAVVLARLHALRRASPRAMGDVIPLCVLGLTADGFPVHPLRQPAVLMPRLYGDARRDWENL